MKRTLDTVAGKTGRDAILKSLAVAMASSIALSACSKVPDAINPAAWYRSTTDIASDDAKSGDAAKNDLQAGRDAPPPGSDGSTPNLSRVDQQMAQRQNMSTGLTADTQGRKYAESVQRQDEAPQNSLYAEDKAPAAPQVEAQKAAPAPQPAKPVTTADMKAPPATPTVTQSAQQTTQEPVTAVSPGPDPSFGVDPGMRERLQQQLAEIQARAADQGSLLPTDLGFNGDGQSTVIISSGGVQTAMAPSAMQFQISGQNTGGMPMQQLAMNQVSNNGALPLPAASTKVATILFNNGSAGLDANDRKILTDVARLQRQNNATVRVIGHASQRTQNMDPAIHKQANFQVSVKRANQVASELQRMGISSDKILTAAVGDNNPIYLEVMPSGEAGNRRTEIYLSN
jgi:outer membrane protein OmpA-like peptidoglycan-associated protein